MFPGLLGSHVPRVVLGSSCLGEWDIDIFYFPGLGRLLGLLDARRSLVFGLCGWRVRVKENEMCGLGAPATSPPHRGLPPMLCVVVSCLWRPARAPVWASERGGV